jgi:hypothetical protein
MIKCHYCKQPFHNIYAYSAHRDWQPTKLCLSPDEMNKHGMALISGAWVTSPPHETEQTLVSNQKKQA